MLCGDSRPFGKLRATAGLSEASRTRTSLKHNQCSRRPRPPMRYWDCRTTVSDPRDTRYAGFPNTVV